MYYGLTRITTIIALLLLPLGAFAQQPSPADQLAQAQAMVSTLYRQLNTAIQDGAQQEALRVKLQQEVERLKAQVAEMQKKAPADGKAPEPVSQKEN